MRKKWTNAMIDQLRQLLASGKTARQISAELGVSRNSIIGKANRLNLARGGAIKKIEPAKPKPVKPVQSKHGVLFPGNGKQCLWIDGEVSRRTLICGQPKLGDAPYCQHHCHVSYPSWHE